MGAGLEALSCEAERLAELATTLQEIRNVLHHGAKDQIPDKFINALIVPLEESIRLNLSELSELVAEIGSDWSDLGL